MANKPFSIRLAWGEPDEDLYRYAGRHHDEQDAIRAARGEMDRAYNENYRDALDDQFRRGIDVGQQTTQYEVVTIVEDVNEYAASDMLEVLKDVSAYLADELSETPETEDPDAHALLKRVNEAILNGEARG